MAKRYYKFKEFAEIIGVDRHTLNNWKKSGKLVPLIDEEGKKYYSEEQLELFAVSAHGQKVNDAVNWVDLTSIEYDRIRRRYDWKKACKKKQIVSFCYNDKNGCFTLLRIKNNTLTIEIDGKEDTIR